MATFHRTQAIHFAISLDSTNVVWNARHVNNTKSAWVVVESAADPANASGTASHHMTRTETELVVYQFANGSVDTGAFAPSSVAGLSRPQTTRIQTRLAASVGRKWEGRGEATPCGQRP
jgi:hypothetical protein